MMRLITAAVVVLSLVGCSPKVDSGPDKIGSFQRNGLTYQWAVANGVVGGLSLLRFNSVHSGSPNIIMTCQNRLRGGLQLRDDLARSGPISISVDDVRFTVDATFQDGFEVPVVQGEGYFPNGWFLALAAAQTVTIKSGDGEAVMFQGPSAPAVDQYKRYCTELSRHQQD